MATKLRLLICGGAIGVTSLGVILYVHLGLSAHPSGIGPKIVFDRLRQDFGDVVPNQTLRTAFTFHNSGYGALRIASVKASCGCTVGTVSSPVIDAGESAIIDVTVGVANASPVAHTVFVESNDPASPLVQLRLVANAVWPVEAQPGTVYISKLVKGETEEREIQILSRSGKPFRILNCTSTSPAIVIEEVQDRGRSHLLRVRITPNDIGSLKESIVVNTDNADRPVISVDIAGQVLGKALVTPLRLLLGMQRPSSQATIKLTIDVSGNEHMVDAVVAKDDGWKVLGFSCEHKDSCALDVTIQMVVPVAPGFHRSSLAISLQGNELSVPVSCLVTND
jgi:hypothetical protein